jgi:hypothetical protein
MQSKTPTPFAENAVWNPVLQVKSSFRYSLLKFLNLFALLELFQVQGERQIEVGRVALSNMLGSIGYFYGQSRIAIPLKFRVSNPPSP